MKNVTKIFVRWFYSGGKLHLLIADYVWLKSFNAVQHIIQFFHDLTCAMPVQIFLLLVCIDLCPAPVEDCV